MVTYSCCPEDNYPNLDYTLSLQRKSKFYSQNLLVPCVLISMLAPFTFLLPGKQQLYKQVVKINIETADSGEKISLGVTILLSLTVFQLIVAEQMPPSEDIPIIGEFYLYTMALVSTSILVTIAVLSSSVTNV